MDIYVGNLSYSVTDADLQAYFEKHGKVSAARVVMDRATGRSKGFGFVEMADRAEAEKAIAATNGVEFMERALRVNESQPKPREDRRGGGGGGGGGFGGGRSGGGRGGPGGGRPSRGGGGDSRW
jgi:RNA recognition motif-containing protein